MRIAVYDQYWQTSGGGEKYAASFARALAGEHEVELLGHGELDLEALAERLGLELHGLRFRSIEERPGSLADATAGHDLLLNCSYMSSERNGARRGVYVVHFPTPFDHDLSPAKRLARTALEPLLARGRATVEWGTGFHLPERGRLRRYRWTAGVARLYLRAPEGARVPVRLVFAGRPPGAPPLEVEVAVDGRVVERAPVPAGRRAVAAAFAVSGRGFAHPLAVSIRSGNVFVPAESGLGHDRRPLGARLCGIQVGRGPAARLTASFPLFALPPVSLDFLDGYDRLVANSRFTAGWVGRYWGRESDVVYPPVAPISEAAAKEPIVLSVGRFFGTGRGHSKKQLELVHAFRGLAGTLPGWEYHLVGGSSPEDEAYVERVRRAAEGLPVRLHVDAAGGTLRDLYGRASLLWHGAGLGEDAERHPYRLEHFGIAIVEAMSAGVVPLVFAGGGPAEIVEHGTSGLLFETAGQLVEHTRALAADEALRRRLAEGARRRAAAFAPERFDAQVRELVAAAMS